MGETINIPPDERRRIRRRRVPQLNAQPPATQSIPWQRLELAFNGAWVADTDALKIGPQNFADLQNLRYTDLGLEGVQGYSRINTAALASPALRSAVQFVRSINAAPVSHLLVQAGGLVYQNLTAPPAQGNFSATTLFTDSAGAGLGRFALAPDGHVIYCNGVDTAIWGGPEHRAGAVINYDDPGLVFRHDITERMQNTLSDASNRFTLVRDAANDIWLHIGSTRPIQGIRFYLQTVNTAASTSTVEYWNGAAWTAVAGFTDGTAVGGVTLAQTGTMTCTSTVSTARVRLLDERLLYFYRVRVGATGTPDATIALYHVTVDAPMQQIVDLWNGVLRRPIFAYSNAEYSLEVIEPSSSVQPIAMEAGATAGITVIFEERMTALKFHLLDAVNSVVATATVNYWNGTAYASVGTIQDLTVVAGATLARSGTMSWHAPAPTTETRKTGEEALYVGAGINGYAYALDFSLPLSASVLIDTITGIPAQRFSPQVTIPGYRFPFLYQNRVMVGGRAADNAGNRLDYCATGNPDVWNGEDSSDQGKEIYVGDHEELMAGVELLDQYSSLSGRVIQSIAVLLKRRQTWMLRGGTPETFQLFPVSQTIGCPCPLTLAVAAVTTNPATQEQRTVAMWVSAIGPMMFDGSSLAHMEYRQPDGQVSSIAPYFDPNDSRYVTVGSLLNARGWFDPQWGEYNVLLPTAGSTTCNAWLACDLHRRKWYRKVPAIYPQMGFNVLDSTGGSYVYGGIDTGFLLRLEHGNTWDGSAIVHQVDTADLLPTQSLWDVVLLRYVKALVVRETGVSATLTLGHAADGSGTFTTRASLDVVGGTARWRKVTQALNLRGWSHQWRLSLTTNDKAKAPQLLVLGFLYRVERIEES